MKRKTLNFKRHSRLGAETYFHAIFLGFPFSNKCVYTLALDFLHVHLMHLYTHCWGYFTVLNGCQKIILNGTILVIIFYILTKTHVTEWTGNYKLILCVSCVWDNTFTTRRWHHAAEAVAHLYQVLFLFHQTGDTECCMLQSSTLDRTSLRIFKYIIQNYTRRVLLTQKRLLFLELWEGRRRRRKHVVLSAADKCRALCDHHHFW